MKLFILIFTMTTLAASLVFAEGAESHHAEGGIPKVVIWQALNMAIIFGYAYYKFGGKIADLFKTRNAEFLREAEKSKNVQQEAEKKLYDIRHKISNLESSTQESIERARAEAADLRRQLEKEAKQYAERIRREAETVAQVEIQGAKRALHEEVVRESIKMAKELLIKDVGQNDQQRLQDQFSKHIDSVRLGANA
jgi:F0F1-type ATP synthase membrane subunit b/b'